MGIPRFFRALSNRYKSKIITTLPVKSHVPVNVDNFWLDMNGIVHDAAQWTYAYGGYSKQQPQVNLSLPEDEILKVMFKRVGYNIDRIVNVVRPRKRLIIALDGVCPRAKQQQQRKRRFRSACESASPFDSNAITPGTTFMKKLSEYFEFLIRFKMQRNAWGNIQVIFSDSTEPGEGEHKIAKMIKKYPTEIQCIYGLDADLVLIALVSPSPNVYLLRENVWNTEQLQFHFVDIASLRGELVNELTMGRAIDSRQVIYDFVVMMNLIGNDFIPHQPIMSDMQWSLPAMFMAYKQANTILYAFPLGQIIHTGLAKFLRVFIPMYQEHVEKEMAIDYEFPHKTLMKATVVKIDWKSREIEYLVNFDLYQNILDRKVSRKETTKYIYFLDWVCTYYFSGVSDWLSVYDSNHAPSLVTLMNMLEVSPQQYQVKTTVIPSVQSLLMYVLPSRSKPLIPEKMLIPEFEYIMNSECHVENDGTDVAWMGHTEILMPSDKELRALEKVSKPIPTQLPTVYSMNPAIKYKFENAWGYVAPCNVDTTKWYN